MEEKKDKRSNPLLRALAFLLTLALVLGAVFLVANWQKLNFDFIKRRFAYRSLAKNDAGQAESYPYSGGISSAFAQVNGDLLVCSTTGIRLYSPAGEPILEEACSLSDPVCAAVGATALVYDAGGEDLFVYRDREQVFSYAPPSGSAVISASLSAQGRLVVVTQSSGLKGTATVYNDSFQPLLGVNISSRFVTDAVLSPDAATLAVATAGQTGGVYDSQIALYAVNRSPEQSDPDTVYSLGGNTVLALDWSQNALRVVGDRALELVNADGASAGSYSYGGRFLKGFALDGDGISALLLGQYRAAANSQLITLDATGTEQASASLSDQVLSLSASGRYLSVLEAGRLVIYDRDLTIYHQGSDVPGARKVLQHSDGSATLIAGETARLYLPD